MLSQNVDVFEEMHFFRGIHTVRFCELLDGVVGQQARREQVKRRNSCKVKGKKKKKDFPSPFTTSRDTGEVRKVKDMRHDRTSAIESESVF